MKVSREWLQTFFDTELPAADSLADAFTFHAFEIESAENDLLDVKITANRGHDCLCHRGLAKELAAILNMPLKRDELREFPASASLTPQTDRITVDIKEPELCRRYVACYVTGVTVGPSPEWLKNRLEAIGQRSINNIVDATNYVMFELGQPLHAFDAGKLSQKDGSWAIAVRKAKDGERMVALDDKEYELKSSMLVITDAHNNEPIGIAGVKGGAAASITEETGAIILEAANFDGPTVRRAAAGIKLRTDASSRFEQVLSPELAAYGMHMAVQLILSIAGGELMGSVDAYPERPAAREVSVSLVRAKKVLGLELSREDIAGVFSRLDFTWREDAADIFTIEVPFERLDLAIPEDLIEEIGRIIGYDNVPAAELPPFPKEPTVNPLFAAAENAREELAEQGYSEVVTSVFADTGDRAVLNKVGGERPFLRRSLLPSLADALERNGRNKDLLGLANVKLFEIGHVWQKGEEKLMLATVSEKGKPEEHEFEPIELPAYELFPLSSTKRYEPFSKYPFVVRDIALWVPEAMNENEVIETLRASASDLLLKSWKFDEYHKDGRVSYAFRLIFQSFDKTLTDGDVEERMQSVNEAAQKRGWEVR